MTPKTIVALLASPALLALAKPSAPESDILKVQTFDWRPDLAAKLATNFAVAGASAAASSGTRGSQQSAAPAMFVSMQHIATEAPPEDKAIREVAQRTKAASAQHSPAGRKLASDSATLLEAVWDRPEFRNKRFDLQLAEGEHPCFAGFAHMVNNTDRCQGWVRGYPAVGGTVVFENTGVGGYHPFELKAVIADHINIWLEEGSTALHEDVSIKAAKIYTNQYNLDELRPAEGSSSWMEHECKIMGSMPFMFTCSNRINILVQKCGITNAWVKQSDYLQNFPGPATAKSPTNHDIIFYMCHELLDDNPNPYAAANTFAHELAHVIQGGFGFSFNTMTEGGATWLEGPLLNLSPRPIVYAWGFQDWNRILAAHIYANTKELNARKFYQIHGMFLAYLSQAALLGDHAAGALQNYQSFESADIPFGRSAYDYYLKYVGAGRPATFEPLTMDVQGMHFAFAEALLNYRVAMVSQCILDAALRPSEPEYQMPASTQERPYWDCSSFPTYWSVAGTSVHKASTDINYGGAAVSRLMLPVSPTVSIAADADPRVRTKVLAAGVSGGPSAEVRELAPGESATFEGMREVYVVQVNVDPAGEMIAPEDRKQLWRMAKCQKPCKGKAWFAGGNGEEEYPSNEFAALQTTPIDLPETTEKLELSFDAMWDMEGEHIDGTTLGPGCLKLGYDGVQVRAIVSNESDGDEVFVLTPEKGYSAGPNGESALEVFAAHFPNVEDCASLEGYTGKSDGWTPQRISLQRFAGKTVRLEWLFASDSSAGGAGFWVDGISVRSGGERIFNGQGASTMRQVTHISSPAPGTVGASDGVPVVVGMPDGYEADENLVKAERSLAAPWSASWAAGSVGSEAALRRSYLGWSYQAPTEDTKTARLHPEHEACVQHVAPFSGHLRSATLFTLVDKIGVSAIRLSFRAAAAPYDLLEGTEPLVSASHGVQDPGMHRFVLGTAKSPLLTKGDAFFVCVGIAEVKHLPADDPNSLPFLHLPLTNVSTAGNAATSGATMLLYKLAAADGAETTGLDPWAGHTFVLRAEFVEEVPNGVKSATPVVPPTGSAGFLAAKTGGN